MELNNVLIAFGLTLFAGLSTGIGSALAFFTKHTNKVALSSKKGYNNNRTNIKEVNNSGNRKAYDS